MGLQLITKLNGEVILREKGTNKQIGRIKVVEVDLQGSGRVMLDFTFPPSVLIHRPELDGLPASAHTDPRTFVPNKVRPTVRIEDRSADLPDDVGNRK